MNMASSNIGRRERNQWGAWILQGGGLGKKASGLLLWQYRCWHRMSLSLDERKEQMSIFKHFLIYIPTTPCGKMEFLPCCFGGAVGDIFSLIMALVLGIIVPNPHQQPVDLPVELALFYVNATLTRKWATCSLLLYFAISNSKNHTT